MDSRDTELAKQLWALGDETRLKILRMLPTSPDCKNCCNVTQIAERLGLSQPTITHHLTRLRQAGIVQNRKMCRDVFYWVDREALEGIAAQLLTPEEALV